MNNSQLINEVITRSVDSVYPSAEALRERLESGGPLRIYMGIDPTATYVHLGHSTNYLLLERLHKLGHKIIVLVGDFTAMIGDPSDKSAARSKLSKEEVKQNLESFKAQIGKILDFEDKENPIEFRFNSEWLSKLNFEDLAELASNFTVQQMIARDAFQKRLAEDKPLFVHEFFYPLMQGYDSVALDVDMEIGGTDQTFNMLAGRTLLKRYKNKEKFVLTTTLLVNPKTGEKLMSKSLGTGVGLNDSPSEMFGKIMALPDEGIIQCFVDSTRLSLDEIDDIKRELEAGGNPRDAKLRLAAEVVEMYHGTAAAEAARESFLAAFSGRGLPAEMPEFNLAGREMTFLDVLAESGLATSKGEGRRLIEQGAVEMLRETGEPKKVEDPSTPATPGVLKIGKHRFLRLGEDINSV